MTHRIAFNISDDVYNTLVQRSDLPPAQAIKDLVYYTVGAPIEVTKQEARKVQRAQEMIEHYRRQQEEIESRKNASGTLLTALNNNTLTDNTSTPDTE